MDDGRNLYKVYYGLKLFGDFLKSYSTMCASSSQGGLTVLAAKSGDGTSKGFLVTDYRSHADEIEVEVKGVPADAKATAWVHDDSRNFESLPVSFVDGKLLIKKADANSAAFWVKF